MGCYWLLAVAIAVFLTFVFYVVFCANLMLFYVVFLLSLVLTSLALMLALFCFAENGALGPAVVLIAVDAADLASSAFVVAAAGAMDDAVAAIANICLFC